MAPTKRWERTRFWSVGLGIVTSVWVSLWSTNAGADIVITHDDWDKFQSLVESPGETLIDIPTTADGLKSLHFTLPHGDKYALYELNVTQLPGGRNRFPVQLIARQHNEQEGGFSIRNLSLDPEPDPSLQFSFISIGLSARGRGIAQDDLFEMDIDASIGDSGGRARNPAADTASDPTGTITTVNATLDLDLGAPSTQQTGQIERLDETVFVSIEASAFGRHRAPRAQ